MPANYYTITAMSEYEIEIKKSRFITYLLPIEDEEEVADYLAKIKKQHYKANHHCSAYILKEDASIQRMSDDGEPTGTAGVPMLEVLKRQALTNVLVIVVRYFGGIKLGAGGLIRAYSSAVSEALQQAIIMQNITQMIVSLTLQYSQVDSFQYFLAKTSLPFTVMETTYLDKVTFDLAINQEAVKDVYDALIAQFNGQIEWSEMGKQTVNIPLR